MAARTRTLMKGISNPKNIQIETPFWKSNIFPSISFNIQNWYEKNDDENYVIHRCCWSGKCCEIGKPAVGENNYWELNRVCNCSYLRRKSELMGWRMLDRRSNSVILNIFSIWYQIY